MFKKDKKSPLIALSGYISWLLAVLWLVLGLIFAIWPSFSSSLLCYLVAFLLGLYGIGLFFWSLRKLARQTDYPYNLEFAAVFLAVSIWIFLNPKTFLSIIPILCGVLFFIHGLIDAMKAWKLNKRKQDFWWTALAAGGILLVLGGILFFQPFKTLESTLRFTGISLIFNGLADFWLCFCLSFAGKHSLKEEGIPKDEEESYD